MLTVSVSYPYLGGFIYSYRVLFSENGVFFPPFLSCLSFTHKKAFLCKENASVRPSQHASEYF